MATENPGWGYTRLRGALSNLGYEIGRSTIKRILGEQGIEPAQVRGRKTSWAIPAPRRERLDGLLNFYRRAA